jgi:hypothetical protein
MTVVDIQFNIDGDTADFVQKRPKAKQDLEQELGRKGKAYVGTWEQKRTSALGAVGEKLIRWHLTQLGCNVIESFDPFDRVKDFTYTLPSGPPHLLAEVKTQSPYYNKRAFTIRLNQLDKMKNVDNCFFVETPILKGMTHWTWRERNFIRQGHGAGSDKDASKFHSRVWSFTNDMKKNIEDIMVREDVTSHKENFATRSMYLIPIDKLVYEFVIDEPKHLVMLDQYSTEPLGLKL